MMWVMLLNKQKPYYCTEHYHVNAGATSIESGLSYSGRSDTNLSEARESAEEETTFRVQKDNEWLVVSEVSRGHSKPATSCPLLKQTKAEVSQKDEGLND